MTPKENTSAALPYIWPARRSGALHSGELMSWLSCAVASPSRSARLRLKSASLASHLSVTSRLYEVRSRCGPRAAVSFLGLAAARAAARACRPSKQHGHYTTGDLGTQQI